MNKHKTGKGVKILIRVTLAAKRILIYNYCIISLSYNNIKKITFAEVEHYNSDKHYAIGFHSSRFRSLRISTFAFFLNIQVVTFGKILHIQVFFSATSV